MASVDRIPQEKLEAARRRLKRRIAAQIIWAMAEEDVTFEDIDARLGTDGSFGRDTRQYVHDLIEGRGAALDPVSDLCLAIGREPIVTIRKIPAEPAVKPEESAE